jgi:hypothetical protein
MTPNSIACNWHTVNRVLRARQYYSVLLVARQSAGNSFGGFRSAGQAEAAYEAAGHEVDLPQRDCQTVTSMPLSGTAESRVEMAFCHNAA